MEHNDVFNSIAILIVLESNSTLSILHNNISIEILKPKSLFYQQVVINVCFPVHLVCAKGLLH